MQQILAFFEAINAMLLSVPALLGLLGIGVLLTIWSGFGQWRSLSHGVQLLRGRVPFGSNQAKGACSHFQALSATLSAIVGLGNIGGMASAVSINGPGAVFWMWMVGDVVKTASGRSIAWRPLASNARPQIAERGLFLDYPAATLTAIAFDSPFPGSGQWMVTLTVWLFAVSTMISWSYYGEQGVIYLAGERWVTLYRWIWCALIFVACLGFIRIDRELDTISTAGLGFRLAINIPTMLILASKAITAWHNYFRRLRIGDIGARLKS